MWSSFSSFVFNYHDNTEYIHWKNVHLKKYPLEVKCILGKKIGKMAFGKRVSEKYPFENMASEMFDSEKCIVTIHWFGIPFQEVSETNDKILRKKMTQQKISSLFRIIEIFWIARLLVQRRLQPPANIPLKLCSTNFRLISFTFTWRPSKKFNGQGN